jgi:2-iminobutanoate/2-iminopropanoate deaminase
VPDRELFVIPETGNPQWYSNSSRYGDLVWTAGQIGRRADGTWPEDFADQVEVTLDNLDAALAIAGADFGTLLKVNTYLSSLDDFAAYNEVYTRRLADHGVPPRTTVEIVRFPPPMLVEIEAVAHVRS